MPNIEKIMLNVPITSIIKRKNIFTNELEYYMVINKGAYHISRAAYRDIKKESVK